MRWSYGAQGIHNPIRHKLRENGSQQLVSACLRMGLSVPGSLTVRPQQKMMSVVKAYEEEVLNGEWPAPPLKSVVPRTSGLTDFDVFLVDWNFFFLGGGGAGDNADIFLEARFSQGTKIIPSKLSFLSGYSRLFGGWEVKFFSGGSSVFMWRIYN